MVDSQYLRQKKAQLAALGQWSHINCLRPNATERIQDAILHNLVHVPESDSHRNTEEANGTQQSRASALLEAVGLENVLRATRPPLPVEALPGGSISFLFERTSKMPLKGSTTPDTDDLGDD